MKKTKIPMIILAAIAASVTLAGCDPDDEDTLKTIYGESIPLGDGTLRTFLLVGEGNKPHEFGVEFNVSWESLPIHENPMGNHTHTYLPPMPPGSEDVVPFKHITFDWQPMGHHPEGIYDLPHVDAHFYLVSQEDRMSILPGACNGVPPVSCDTREKALTPLPPNWQPPYHTNHDAVVPFMGAHLHDPRSDEFNGQPFSNTFIFGTYDGAITFLEPMVTRAHFESLSGEDCRPVDNPEQFKNPGWYPNAYCLKKAGDKISVSFSDFNWMQ